MGGSFEAPISPKYTKQTYLASSNDERPQLSDVCVIALQSSVSIVSALSGWQMFAVALFLSLTVLI